MPYLTTVLDGGLDLKSSPIVVEPGRLIACENYEVALQRGYRWIDGYERFDGGSSPSVLGTKVFRLSITDTVPFDPLEKWLQGQNAFIYAKARPGVFREVPLVVVRYDLDPMDPTKILYLYVIGGSVDAATFLTTGSGSSANTINTVYQQRSLSWVKFNPKATVSAEFITGTVQQDLQLRKDLYTTVRSTVQQVPGQGSVIGLHWMKDALYAVRDYVTLQTDTVNAGASEGDVLYQGASLATATFSGTVIQVASSPTDLNQDAGIVMLTGVQGTPTLAVLNNDTTGDPYATVTEIGVAAVGAGLYKAVGTRDPDIEGSSWEHQDLGYTCDYANGELDFTPANRISTPAPEELDALIQTTPWFVADADPTTLTQWSSNLGGTLAAALATDDGDTSYVTSLLLIANRPVSESWWVSDFGITESDIPPGSLITGIEFEVKRRAYRFVGATGTVRDHTFEFRFSDGQAGVQVGDLDTDWNVSNVTPDNPQYSTKTYGGRQNLLGYSNLSNESFIGPDFSFRMNAQAVGLSGGSRVYARITFFRMRVHYVPPQSKIYFWNGTSAVISEVVSSYKTSGSIDTQNAAGHLFLMNYDHSRQVGENEEIRTYPGPGVVPDGGASDGSLLIATTSTAVKRNVLDSSSAIAAQESKYQSVTGNFYATVGFEAIYGVTGAGPAWMYDGYAFSRVYTGLSDSDEMPRHVAIHQARLVLGYAAGTIQFSSPGLPLTFDPLNFAGEIGLASKVNGMYPLNGDSLSVFLQGGVAVVQGDLSTSPYPSQISPDVGCVEYTAQSMGSYLYTSFRGIQNLRATSAYGDFDTNIFSEDVWTWLRPRVQTSVFFEGADDGVINSIAVRNKHQYRLFFKDARFLTATFLDPGRPPQYTMGTYRYADGSPRTWDVTLAAVELHGRDRLFGATDDGTGWVFELDRGNSFDGGQIVRSLTLVVEDQKAPATMKQYLDMGAYGTARGYADFTMSRSVNYEYPDPAIFYSHSFGELSNPSTGLIDNFASFTPNRIAGRNLTIQFNSATDMQFPATLQAITYTIEQMAEKRT